MAKACRLAIIRGCWLLRGRLFVGLLGLVSAASVSAQLPQSESPNTEPQAVDALELPAPAWEAVAPAEIGHALRQAGHHPVDELDRPRFTRRQNHRGYEVRTFHFVVTSTHSAAQAEALAVELETAWRDVGKLADAFTGNHRQPTFGLNAVGVLASDQPFSDRAEPVGPNPVSADSDLYIYTPGGEVDGQQRFELRRQAARSLLRVAQLDQTLPTWAQQGLIELTARQAVVSLPDVSDIAAEGEVDAQRPVVPQLHTAPQTWLTRSAADRLPTTEPAPGTTEALAYLLLADDAQHAPRALQALRETVQSQPASGPAIGRVRQAALASSVAGQEAMQRQAAFVPEAITGQVDFNRRLGSWARDPWRDVPALVVENKDDAELISQATDLLVLIKLARRFGTAEPSPIQPQIRQWRHGAAQPYQAVDSGQDSKHPSGVAHDGQHEAPAVVAAQPMLNVAQLLERLSDPGSKPWATLDAEGRLVLWYDQPRVAQLLGNESRQLSNGSHKGQATFEARLRDGRVVEAWWQEPTAAGQRPEVHAQWK